jgi:hypothetical protein
MRLGLALAASALLATGAQAVTVVNSSFEQGVAITGGSVFLPAPPIDTTSIPGWRILSNGVDYADSTLWDASAGSRSLELAGSSSGGVQQAINNAFVVGKQYRIRWDMSVNPFAANGTYQALVSATGGGGQFFSYTKTAANTPTNMLYQNYEYIWTAANVSSSFQFRSRGNGSQGVVIDNVSISLVPEPAQWMLLIAGFGMTGYAMRRRRIRTVAA